MDSPRRIAHAAALLALASCSREASPTSPASSESSLATARHALTPRVILVTCDTLRADHLGVYGYPRPTSPNVDALARDSAVFESAYTTAPMTGAALSSMLSGLLPDELGLAGGNRFLMSSDVTTWPELLRDDGVSTAAIVSNWVLRKAPRAQGDVGVQQGFQHFDDRMPEREGQRESYERRASETTDAALEWLASAPSSADARTFLWVHYQDPHGPYTPPKEMLAALERPLTTEVELPIGATRSGKGQIPHYQAVDGERAPESYRKRYDGEIRHFDTHFGRLIESLKQRSWYDDALIVFSADHGESLGEHGYWFCHGENVHREVVRVPLIVKYPRGAARPAWAANGRVSELVSLLDIGPTVLEALGVAVRASRGASLLASSLPSNRVVSQAVGQPGTPERWFGASDGRWRLIQEGRLAPRLFDLSNDAGEEHDLAAAQPQLARELAQRVQTFIAERKERPHVPVTMEATSENERALNRTGYAGDDEH